jgi:hypothetical protein
VNDITFTKERKKSVFASKYRQICLHMKSSKLALITKLITICDWWKKEKRHTNRKTEWQKSRMMESHRREFFHLITSIKTDRAYNLCLNSFGKKKSTFVCIIHIMQVIIRFFCIQPLKECYVSDPSNFWKTD